MDSICNSSCYVFKCFPRFHSDCFHTSCFYEVVSKGKWPVPLTLCQHRIITKIKKMSLLLFYSFNNCLTFQSKGDLSGRSLRSVAKCNQIISIQGPHLLSRPISPPFLLSMPRSAAGKIEKHHRSNESS